MFEVHINEQGAIFTNTNLNIVFMHFRYILKVIPHKNIICDNADLPLDI